MAYLTMKQLLEAGVHFGHQTKRWNPKMKRYIFGARNGIYIIDLQQTVRMFKTSYDLVKDITSEGGAVLFVGTKRQAQSAIAEESQRCEMNYVNQRWIGGLLTNFATVKKSIKKLLDLDEMKSDNYSTVIKKEGLMLEKARLKLEKTLGGIRSIKRVPDAVFVVDTKKESLAVKEARKLDIPVIGIVDSNCDPDDVDYIIPGNDDAIRAIKLFSASIAEACIEGKAIYQEKLQAAQDKADEEKRIKDEERKAREEEQKIRDAAAATVRAEAKAAKEKAAKEKAAKEKAVPAQGVKAEVKTKTAPKKAVTHSVGDKTDAPKVAPPKKATVTSKKDKTPVAAKPAPQE